MGRPDCVWKETFMTSYLLVLFCFLISFILHVLLRKHIPVLIAYMAGACLLFVFVRMGLIQLPWSSGLLFMLLSCTAMLFYIAISLGTELPTSIILESFKKKKEQSLSQLTALFSDKGLILNRVDDLVQSGLVDRTGQRLTMTTRGNTVWNIMRLYQLAFNRKRTE